VGVYESAGHDVGTLCSQFGCLTCIYLLFLVAYDAPGASRHRDLLHTERTLLCSPDGIFAFGRA
jgi:hypothetical protein